MPSQTAVCNTVQHIQLGMTVPHHATIHVAAERWGQQLLTGRLAAAEASAWATGLAVATEGGVVAAPGFLPKKDEMSRCFMLALATATLLTLMIWLSRTLYARLSVFKAVSMEQTSTPLYRNPIYGVAVAGI